MRGPLLVTLCLVLGLLLPTTLTSGAQGPPASSWNHVVEYNTTGEAGEWALIYYSLKDHPDPFAMTWFFNFTTSDPTGGPVFTFLAPPDHVGAFPDKYSGSTTGTALQAAGLSNPDGQGVTRWLGHARTYYMPQGEPFQYSEGYFPRVYVGLDDHLIAGIAVFAASSAPWNLDLRVVLTSGQGDELSAPPPTSIVGPTLVSRGSGMTYGVFDEAPISSFGTTGYTAGVIDAAFSYETAGWTHAQYEWENDAPFYATVHSYDFSFPDGYRYVGPVVVQERDPLTGWEPIALRTLGTMMDAPGNFHAKILRADNAKNISLRVVHFPMASEDFGPLDRMEYACRFVDGDFRYPPGLDTCEWQEKVGVHQPAGS